MEHVSEAIALHFLVASRKKAHCPLVSFLVACVEEGTIALPGQSLFSGMKILENLAACDRGNKKAKS